MSDQPMVPSEPIRVEQLTEAIASGVLRALSSHTFTKDEQPVDMAQMVATNGIFGQIVITGGMWPADRRTGGIGGVTGQVAGGAGEQGAGP